MNTHTPATLGGALIALALLVGPAAAEKTDTGGLKIGDAAPAFELPGVDGKTHRLTDFAAAKVLAVVFTCNHCPTAQLYEERIKKLTADYKDRGVALVAISPWAEWGSMRMEMPRLAAHSTAPGEVAATQVGGCGRWRG